MRRQGVHRVVCKERAQLITNHAQLGQSVGKGYIGLIVTNKDVRDTKGCLLGTK